MQAVFSHIRKQSYLKTKTEQIVEGIIDAISCGDLKQGDILPSVNKFIVCLGVSRVTVVRAMNELKKMKVIVAEDKKGYFVNNSSVNRETRVFLMLGGFNSYHEILYNTLLEELAEQNVMIDVYFHHYNIRAFRSILRDNLGSYGLYLISCFDDPKIAPEMARIPPSKLLQIVRAPLFPHLSSIHQDFSEKLIEALNTLLDLFRKYKKIILVYPNNNKHSVFIIHSFVQFCTQNQFEFSVENSVTPEQIIPGTAFWVIEDNNLLELIQFGEAKGLRIGCDYGILSYNETPMKEIIRRGITVISVDFKEMAREIAQFVINRTPVHITLDTRTIIRKSL